MNRSFRTSFAGRLGLQLLLAPAALVVEEQGGADRW